ncbi:hypothetical protein FOXYSP1_19380 [Fusarium oxysporum f. sp. phaseoli]
MSDYKQKSQAWQSLKSIQSLPPRILFQTNNVYDSSEQVIKSMTYTQANSDKEGHYDSRLMGPCFCDKCLHMRRILAKEN